MGVESATFVNDFDATLPTATDLRSQGDDHLRLVKTVLKTTFTRATRAMSIPGTLAKTTNYTVVKDDQEHTIYVSTAAGAATMTLPTLVAGDAGWKVHFIKTTSDANAMFIAPPSGTINSGGISGLAKSRRAIPGVRITAVWDGAGFFVTRALALPIGSTIEFNLAGLPPGYEWPNGQTLASASTNYPEYNSAAGSGLTADHRGRYVGGKDDMGGSAAGRITTAGGAVDGVTLGAVGGVQSIPLAANQIPSLTSVNAAQAISVSSTLTDWVRLNGVTFTGAGPGGGACFTSTPASGQVASSGNNSISVTYTNASQQTVKNLPTTIICNKILVVE